MEQELARIKEEIITVGGFSRDVQRVLECLYAHLFEEAYNVNMIIEQCGVQKATISGRFKLCIGVGIRAYRQRLRMKAAKLLLACEDLEIYRIADRLGYSNYTSFARAFHKEAECSPALYREKMCRENV